MVAVPELNNLTGKVALVTGGNQGIGFWTVYHLSKAGAKVYLGARSASKANVAIQKLKSMPGAKGQVEFIEIELEDPRGVKAAAEALLAKEDRLDILVSNAALQASEHAIGKDGIQKAFVINHLSPFVLVRTLEPLLEKTSKLPGSDVRVVIVSSVAHGMAGKEVTYKSLENINQSYEGKSMANVKRYSITKLANLLYARELQSRFDAKGVNISSITLHPGGVWTEASEKFVRALPMGGALAFILSKVGTMSPEEGSFTSLFAAASPKVAADFPKYRAAYLTPVGKITKPSGLATDVELQKTLWTTTERLLAETYQL